MTSIFTRFTELDPALLERQVEASAGGPVFDAFSLLDQQRMAQQAAAALGGTLSNAALLDPARALAELDALADAGGGGGGDVPEWMPDGATTFLDFVASHFYAGGAERSLSDVLATASDEPDLSNWDGSAFTSDGFGNTNPLNAVVKAVALSAFAEDCTVVVEFSDEGATSSANILWYFEETYTNYVQARLVRDDQGSYIYQTTDNSEELDFTGVVGGQTNRVALTVTATKFSASVNGAATTTLSKASELMSQTVDFQLATNGGSEFIRSVTVYAALDDAALPALSALS